MRAFGVMRRRLAASALAGLFLLVGAGCGTAREWADGSGGAGKTSASAGGGGGASTAAGGASTGSGGTTTTGTKLACASAADCAGGFCVDGVCCDVRCDDLCVACTEQLTGQPDGTCAPALKATDPHNDCSKDGAPCGQTGFCDGKGVCALQADPSFVCAGATCADGVRTDAKTCDGAGQCAVGGTTVCVEGCNDDATGCLGDCTDDSCPETQHCDKISGKCVDQTGQGEPCSTAEQCATGFCVDGVCCDAACGDACHTCASGACALAAAGSDLRGDCDAELASTCGKTGACDGAGSCARWGSGTECAPSSCSGSTVTLAKTCDGNGTCAGNGSQACPNGCSGAGCAGGCTPGSCDATQYCGSGGVCTPKKGNGTTCDANEQCSSGYCVDGRCCNSGCGGGCQQCNASGSCVNVGSGQDPKGACGAQAQATCGATGSCDGSGACALWPAGTECAAASCNGTTAIFAKTCNGGGTCLGNGTQACPNGCSGAVCAGACTPGSCGSGQYCASGGACTPKKGNGTICEASEQCSSGFCVDGVCCNSGCAGGCQQCSSGTCTNVAAGQDPKDACAANSGSTCGNTGECDGSGACAVWPNGFVCAAATCDANKPVPERTCDGAGTCKPVSPGQACVLYQCVAGACKTSCVNNADCSANATCVAGKCKLGGPCEPACGVGEHCCADMPPYCQPMGMSCN